MRRKEELLDRLCLLCGSSVWSLGSQLCHLSLTYHIWSWILGESGQQPVLIHQIAAWLSWADKEQRVMSGSGLGSLRKRTQRGWNRLVLRCTCHSQLTVSKWSCLKSFDRSCSIIKILNSLWLRQLMKIGTGLLNRRNRIAWTQVVVRRLLIRANSYWSRVLVWVLRWLLIMF